MYILLFFFNMTQDASSELQYVIIEALILAYNIIIIIKHFNFNDGIHIYFFKSKIFLWLTQLSGTNLTRFGYLILVIDVIMFCSSS